MFGCTISMSDLFHEKRKHNVGQLDTSNPLEPVNVWYMRDHSSYIYICKFRGQVDSYRAEYIQWCVN